MLYMVVEQYKDPGGVEVYRRAREKGRMLPDGLHYVSSWVDLGFTTCFQLMETDQPELFDRWTGEWRDLVDFRILPVRTSADAMKAIGSIL